MLQAFASPAARPLGRAALALLLAPLCALGEAPPTPLGAMVVLSADREPYTGVVEGLRRHDASTALRLEVFPEPGLVPGRRWQAARSQADVIVAVGTEAARHLAARDLPEPLIYVLVPRSELERLGPVAGPGRSAITIDQPLVRPLALARALVPDMDTVATLLGPQTGALAGEFERTAARLGLDAVSLELSPGSRTVDAIRGLPTRVDAVVAIPDPTVHDRRQVKALLLATYRRRLPLVAFSPAYVTAGAVAAVYTSPEQIGRQLGDLLAAYAARRQAGLPPPAPPTYVSVATNEAVARSLGLRLPAPQALVDRLRETDPTLR